jgi:hypothetical protein
VRHAKCVHDPVRRIRSLAPARSSLGGDTRDGVHELHERDRLQLDRYYDHHFKRRIDHHHEHVFWIWFEPHNDDGPRWRSLVRRHLDWDRSGERYDDDHGRWHGHEE